MKSDRSQCLRHSLLLLFATLLAVYLSSKSYSRPQVIRIALPCLFHIYVISFKVLYFNYPQTETLKLGNCLCCYVKRSGNLKVLFM